MGAGSVPKGLPGEGDRVCNCMNCFKKQESWGRLDTGTRRLGPLKIGGLHAPGITSVLQTPGEVKYKDKVGFSF